MRARAVVVVGLFLGSPAAAESPGFPDAATMTVSDVAGLQAAFAQATAGEIIELLPGTYVITASLTTGNSGVTIRAAGPLGSVVLESSVVEAIRVTQPNWTFQRLEVRGVCADDSTCEHAFHVTGLADGTTIVGCRLVDFNAQIKGNGAPVGPAGAMVWPDDVAIVGNELFDTRARQTANPVTKIDVVGGRRWQIVGNDLHDYEKAGGDQVSYGAFLKGNSREGLMHRNRVVCAQAFAGGTRIGLSLGGGGSAPDSICEDATCTPEHQAGWIQDNVIAHCSDVGIYLNEATSTMVLHNTIYDTAGVDFRFATSTGAVSSNLIGGAVRDRDGGTHVEFDNLVGITPAEWTAWFTDPDAVQFGLRDGTDFVDRGANGVNLRLDFCGNDRDDGAPDIGAVEYDVDLVDPMQFCSPLRTAAQDAATADAAGPGATGDGGGCGCRTGGDPAAGLALLALAFLTARRRR
jgi:MYXO-CTERM domain-containing protein